MAGAHSARSAGGSASAGFLILRIGYANGSGAALDRSLSTGFAYDAPGRGTVFGLSVNWGRPNRSGSGTATATATEDQYTVEAYYRVQLLDGLAITPDLQPIKTPPQIPTRT